MVPTRIGDVRLSTTIRRLYSDSGRQLRILFPKYSPSTVKYHTKRPWTWGRHKLWQEDRIEFQPVMENPNATSVNPFVLVTTLLSVFICTYTRESTVGQIQV